MINYGIILKKKQAIVISLNIFLAVAASLALIITLFIDNIGGSKFNDSEKEVLLNEAQMMFLNSEEILPRQNIIEESALIVVYTETK
jgi:hypothetical protein